MADIGGKRFPIGWSVEPKPCDACKMAAALLFCRTDSSYMCIDCDAKLHGNNTHERVWMCEVCEQAPASVTCKADAAALCVRCDRDIHSANPLASRHERVPVLPFFNDAVSVVNSTGTMAVEIPVVPESDPAIIGYKSCKNNICAGHEEINNSWLPSTNCDGSISKLPVDIQADMKSIEFLFSDPDNLLEFDYPVPNHPMPLYNHQNSGVDSVVPVQANIKLPPPPPSQSSLMDQSADNPFEIDFTSSNISNSFNSSYTAQSISQNIPTSSIDVGVVPDGSCISDISYPFALQMYNNLNSSANGNCQTSIAMDREARVMRYREKRKNRKFEKTIRYASRKAYAETRPRIKGRFAKRSEDTNDQGDIDRWFPSGQVTTNFMGNSTFGVVPSF